MITNKKSGKKKVSIILVSLIVILFNSWGDRNIVAEYGNLRVEGAHLKGNPGIVSLKGFSSHGIQWFPFKDDSTIPNMVADFGADVIRIAMYIEHEQMGYLYTPQGPLRGRKYMTEQVNMMVQDAIDAGIYVIIDWHIHNNPNNFTSEAISFFQEMVVLWGNQPNVIFEIANEPQWVSWGDISRYANEVIPAIRAKEDEVWGIDDPDNIIIVGTPDWNQHPDYVVGYELTFSNILYALHFYTASHFGSIQEQAKNAFNAGLPLFISEWGLSECTGGGKNNYINAEKWINWAESNNISWVYWAFDNKEESSAVLNSFEWDNENNEHRWRENEGGIQSGPWKDSDLTNAGHWVRNRMGWTAATPTPTPKPTLTPAPILTPTPTIMRWATPIPTFEPTPTLTPIPTLEPTPTLTPIPTFEPTPTLTPIPTLEPTPILTPIPTLEPTLTPTPSLEPEDTKPGKSSKNPIKIIQNSISYFIDLNDGYVWVEFPDPITGWAIENTGYSFNVQLEKDNRSIIEKTANTWYYMPQNPNLKKSGLVKIVNRGVPGASPNIIIRYWY